MVEGVQRHSPGGTLHGILSYVTGARFDSTISLGSILQIVSLFVTMIGAVWYVSAQQGQLVEANKAQAEHLARTDAALIEVRAEAQRRDVAVAESSSMREKMDMVISELQAIRQQIGLAPKEWKAWRNDE